MEEQNKNGKVVNMDNSANSQNEGQEKLSYEELNNAAIQLSKENAYLKSQLKGASDALRTFSRLDYLFRVVECAGSNRNNSVTFANDFVEKCVEEIQNLMTLPEETENKEK